jgi:hypothetical protein
MQILNFKVQTNPKFFNFKIRSFKHSFAYLIICLFAYLAAYLLITNLALAQSSQGIDLTVSPPVIELNAKPGDSLRERFRIRNNQSSPIDLKIDVKKLSSDSSSGEPIPAEPSKDDEFISWLTLDPDTATVLPKEWQDVNFTIDIPQNAAYGYYYVLRIQPANQETVKGTGTTVKGEVLVVVLLNVVKDGAKAKANLVEFKPNIFFGEYLPVEFTAKVANSGNVHVKPSGNIFIRSFHQKDIAILDINAGKQTVLPGGTRTFKSVWNDGFIVNEPVVENGTTKLDTNGNPVTKLTINWDKLTHFRVGPYTATLLMVYDDGKRDATIEGVTTFWLIPYTAIAVILVGLIAVVLIIRFLLRWYIRRELRRQKGR